ncbi:DUF7130 family rubredoxin-like protein [Natrinema caseinilyticum]|uniref:DUF7130 family rubredoxin-like protein n=1 Tax=Natrinema caseinilyticum TaxID=2961570 RepID=UPI0020C58B5B|nr:hypothetical protein [Natrinema caseinilyticum]
MGETPAREGDQEAVEEVLEVDFGETVYNADGTELGQVRGFERGGFFVTTREGVEAMSVEHARAGHEFGEAELMWRCMECGEMGEIDDGLPDECPNCGRPKENLMYWTED